MLDLDPNRPEAPPRDASTLVVARDAPGGGIEVFCVERHKVGFLGGAIVFPGGKLDASDLDAGWATRATAPRAPATPIAADEATLRGLAVAACREALEEAAILPVAGGAAPSHADLLAWRRALDAKEASLLALLAARDLKLDLAALRPFARWVTPVSESRRFDTRFYLFVATGAVTGAHDDHETTASFWAGPGEVLRRFEAGELQLAPPTHRTLEILAGAKDADAAVALAARSCLEPICPRLFTQRDAQGGVLALALPGDPEHEVREARCPGKSRYVLRSGRFLSEDPPA
jgi:8-oxo-dGTP pyrophosphatase MutT (NUDIX family)